MTINIPNLLSILRIFLVPVFAVVYFQSPADSIKWFAVLIIIVSGITDWLDGFIARRFDMVTRLGKILDPLADKLTQICVVGCLSVTYPIFRILLIIYLVKELAMLTGGLWFIRKFDVVKVSRWFGKVATLEFYLAMILVILFPKMPAAMFYILASITLLFAVYAFIRYAIDFVRAKKL